MEFFFFLTQLGVSLECDHGRTYYWFYGLDIILVMRTNPDQSYSHIVIKKPREVGAQCMSLQWEFKPCWFIYSEITRSQFLSHYTKSERDGKRLILQLVSKRGLKFDSPGGHVACRQVPRGGGIVSLGWGQHSVVAKVWGEAESQSTCGA